MAGTSNPSEPTQSANPHSVLTPADLPAVLRVSRRTADRWYKEKFLPKPDIKRGKVIRWRRATIEAWLADNANA